MKECGHCKDCKWWGEAAISSLDEVEPGEWGECDLTVVVNWHTKHGRTLAFPDLSDTLYSSLTTHRDFGCVQFEAKEQGQGE